MYNATALSLETQLEHGSLRYNSIHKTWGVVTLRSSSHPCRSSPPADFVIAIDISASMRVNSKLAFVQATIEYLLSVLDENQTFSLVTFNHEVEVLATLLPCVEENKEKIMTLVHGLQATGSTNISGALFESTKILNSRGVAEENRISTVMLFTDGLSTRGLSTAATLNSLDTIKLPLGCVFNTFGFGPDQDSKLLHAISLKAQVCTHLEVLLTYRVCIITWKPWRQFLPLLGNVWQEFCQPRHTKLKFSCVRRMVLAWSPWPLHSESKNTKLLRCTV